MIGITGSTGKLGQLIIAFLLEKVQPNEVIAIARSTDKLKNLKEKGVKVRYGDYDDLDSLKLAFKEVNTLMFISGTMVGKREQQHKNVIDAAKENNVEKIVYTSVLLKGEPKAPVQREHYLTENYIKSTDFKFVFLRNTLYADLLVDNVSNIIKKGDYTSSAGDGGVAYISREDIAKVAVKVLTSSNWDNRALDLTGPEVITGEKYVEVINKVTGKQIKYNNLTSEQMISYLKNMGVSEENIQGRVAFDRMIASHGFEHISNDVKEVLGTSAKTLEQLITSSLNE
ncbi:MAG: SDR family oxidoreductase [Promethearchaeota archaeon]